MPHPASSGRGRGSAAQAMSGIPKVVFPKTLSKASWPQSTLANGDLGGGSAVVFVVAQGFGE